MLLISAMLVRYAVSAAAALDRTQNSVGLAGSSAVPPLDPVLASEAPVLAMTGGEAMSGLWFDPTAVFYGVGLALAGITIVATCRVLRSTPGR